MEFPAPPKADISLPAMPRGWYYFCRSSELQPGPARLELGTARYAAFRDAGGRVAVLDARCSHMGADLSRGCVASGALRCPLHAWEYAADGACRHIPTGSAIPPLARQAVFPSAELGGHVFFCNSPVARYPMQFFPGKTPDELLAAEPFDLVIKAPWYMVGVNAFDQQHFRIAHDRILLDTPIVTSPSPFAQAIVANYAVSGSSLRDRFIRRFSGPRVRMSVTIWGGTLIFVEATFQHTTSYGMVCVWPIDENSAVMRTIVWIARRRGALAAVVDPLDAWLRRRFIRAFLTEDAVRSDGVRYNPLTVIDADRGLASYMAWLSSMHAGHSESSQLFQGGSHVGHSPTRTLDPVRSDLDRAAAVGSDDAGRH
jgi:phenylpropionate dioxygenase-like ring-hydroxylating dioxygenase large terminal subunit